jgi:hypothetical protein
MEIEQKKKENFSLFIGTNVNKKNLRMEVALTLNSLQIGSRHNENYTSLLRLPPLLFVPVYNRKFISLCEGKLVGTTRSVGVKRPSLDCKGL